MHSCCTRIVCGEYNCLGSVARYGRFAVGVGKTCRRLLQVQSSMQLIKNDILHRSQNHCSTFGGVLGA